MKVCIFMGSNNFVEDELFQKLLESNNIPVVACREHIHNFSSLVRGYVKLFFKHMKLDYDVMFIHWNGIPAFPLANLICRKPIIYWSNLSIYHTLIEDRKKASPNSLYAKFIHFAEKYVINHSKLIITESKAQSDYFIKEYNLNKEKFRNIITSADEGLFKPIPFKEQKKIFNILFFGSFIPAHGVEIIIEAAKIIQNEKEIVFNFWGDGPTKKQNEELANKYQLQNVKFFGYFTYDKLIPAIFDSDVCLGIFSTSQKAANSIANKILQILASKKPLITMDSPAVKEILLASGKNCILVPSGDPKSLADAILNLKKDNIKRKNIAISGYQLYLEKLSNKVVAKKLMDLFNEVHSLK